VKRIWFGVCVYVLILCGFGRNFAGMQSQIVCHGCRSLLLYPRGAPSVCCAVCHVVSTVPVPPPGSDSELWFPVNVKVTCFCGTAHEQNGTLSFDFITARQIHGPSGHW
jgi:LSD1 subclass zinc finger protein